MLLGRLYHAYNARLSSHPYSTRAIGTAVTYIAADCTAQAIENRAAPQRASEGRSGVRRAASGSTSEHVRLERRPSQLEPPAATLSAERALKFGSVGLLWVGPLLTYWFVLMDRFVPGRTPRAVAVKMLVDQTVQGPLMMGMMFAWCAVLNGASAEAILTRLRAELYTTWVNSVWVWAPVQVIQQAVVPLKYRVAVFNVVSYFWDTYLATKMMPPPDEVAVRAHRRADPNAMPVAAETRDAPVLLRRMSSDSWKKKTPGAGESVRE